MNVSKRSNFTERELRDAFSTFATGVTIVTASGLEGEAIGMTASSFNTVSTKPPLILWSATKNALSGPGFKVAEYFAVHILAGDQQELSNRFATSGIDKFNGMEDAQELSRDENGTPLIGLCLVRLMCRQWAVYEGGDHWIIIGEVLDIQKGKKDEKAEGLLFSKGEYAKVERLR